MKSEKTKDIDRILKLANKMAMAKQKKPAPKPQGLTSSEKATLGRILKKARAFKAFYARKANTN